MDKYLERVNYSAYQFSLNAKEQFDLICAPIYALGIPRFTYTKLFSNGSYLKLDSSIDFLKQYLSQITAPGNEFINQLRFLKKFNTRIFIPSNNIINFNEKTDPTIHLLFKNNIWNNLYIINIIDDGSIELFGFTMTRDDINANHFYFNNLQLLERFIDFFKEKASDLINATDQTKLARFKQNFIFEDSGFEEPVHARAVKEFLQATETNPTLIIKQNMIVKLAPREIECLQYLALGKSIKQIAYGLDLSPRTIEYYISNAKQKTGYRVRQELINEFIKQK